MRQLFTCLFIVISLSAFAQQDTLGRYSPGFKFKDGIYFSFEDFKANCPAIPLADLCTAEGNSLRAIDEEKPIYVAVQDSVQQLDPETFYGYSNSGQIYLRNGEYFNRLLVIGSLCHLIHQEQVIDYSSGGLYDYNSLPVRREVRVEYVIDMQTGEQQVFEPSALEALIADDPVIAREYRGKSRKQKKSALYATMHAYNRKHPVYFSISRCK